MNVMINFIFLVNNENYAGFPVALLLLSLAIGPNWHKMFHLANKITSRLAKLRYYYSVFACGNTIEILTRISERLIEFTCSIAPCNLRCSIY